MNRHARLIKVGLDCTPIYASKLIADYTSSPTSHSLIQAHRIFDQVPCQLKDTALWAHLISACTRSNQPHQALRLFSQMLRQSQSGGPNARPNSYIFTSVARAIASIPEQLDSGEALHAHVIKCGALREFVFVGTALVDMYSKCGVVHYAVKVFEEMGDRNMVTWNAMISGFVQNRMERNGLELFSKMKNCDFCLPDEYTVATVLSCCANVQDLVLGKQVQGYAISGGFEWNCLNLIANMYFCCGEVRCAEKSFDGIRGDDALGNLIKIRGYVSNHVYDKALKSVLSDNIGVKLFHWDRNVIVALLVVCSKLSLLKVGKQLHCLFVTLAEKCYGFNLMEEETAYVGCALIDMYSKCGDIVSARMVFDYCLPSDVSLWNSMISGYIHKSMINKARDLFEIIPQKNVISWTSMMTGYVQNDMPEEALDLLKKMHFTTGEVINGNSLTFVVGLEACSHLTDLERGKQIHGKIIRLFGSSHESNVMVGTALVDMYSKTGKLQHARTVFDLMPEKNVVAWTSIITGYAVHGYCKEALKVFQQMIETGIKPNNVTFIAILTACSHCGLVDEGLHYFKMMTTKYNLIPEDDHHTCVIDMLGRSGRLNEAWILLEEIEEVYGSKCSIDGAWAALLGACHSIGNLEFGERVANRMLEHRKQMPATRIVLSNVYAASGMWKEAFEARERWRKEENVNGEPGLSRIYMHQNNETKGRLS